MFSEIHIRCLLSGILRRIVAIFRVADIGPLGVDCRLSLTLQLVRVIERSGGPSNISFCAAVHQTRLHTHPNIASIIVKPLLELLLSLLLCAFLLSASLRGAFLRLLQWRGDAVRGLTLCSGLLRRRSAFIHPRIIIRVKTLTLSTHPKAEERAGPRNQ